MAIPLLRGLRVAEIPAGPNRCIDIDAHRPQACRIRPTFFVLGGTKVLFPYPVRELRALADEVGGRILHEAAHTMTHRLFLDLRDLDASDVANRCEQANILIPISRLPGERSGDPELGSRISVREVTRQGGLAEPVMARVARLICRAARRASPKFASVSTTIYLSRSGALVRCIREAGASNRELPTV